VHKTYDYLFLSPHLDDVVLSCGASVWEVTAAGRTALIATFFAGDPPQGALPPLAQKAHDLWGLHEDVMHARREEDVRACRELNADYLHMAMIDCVYRRHPRSRDPLYTAQDDVFGSVHPDELHMRLGELHRLISALPFANHVLAPLGLGNHIDHQLVHIAVRQSSVGAVSYYEDYPYCIRVKSFGLPGMNPRVHALSRLALEHKLRAIRAYESQLGPVFSTHQNIRRRMTAHVRSMGGERLWHPLEVYDG
jgi:LmbE family N-acetylglucosaminyl deacetylase